MSLTSGNGLPEAFHQSEGAVSGQQQDTGDTPRGHQQCPQHQVLNALPEALYQPEGAVPGQQQDTGDTPRGHHQCPQHQVMPCLRHWTSLKELYPGSNRILEILPEDISSVLNIR